MIHTIEQISAMAKYILDIFRTNVPVVMSWGIDPDTYKQIEDENGYYGISFTVNGFKHKGTVQVLFDEGADYFVVKLLDDNNQVIKTCKDIFLGELVTAIDNEVEHVENYDSRVSQEYGLRV